MDRDLQTNVSHSPERIVDEKNLDLKWLHLILFFIIFLAASFVLGLVIGIYDVFIEKNLVNALLQQYPSLIFDAAVLGLVWLCYAQVRRFTLPAFHFSSFRKGETYGVIVLGLAALAAVQFIMIGWLQLEEASDSTVVSWGQEALAGGWLQTVLLYFTLAVLTPIKEEIMYRGIIQRFFHVKYKAWLGVVLSAVVFGALHPAYPMTAVLMGVIFALAYQRTQSLYPGMIIHIIWNFYAVSTM